MEKALRCHKASKKRLRGQSWGGTERNTYKSNTNVFSHIDLAVKQNRKKLKTVPEEKLLCSVWNKRIKVTASV